MLLHGWDWSLKRQFEKWTTDLHGGRQFIVWPTLGSRTAKGKAKHMHRLRSSLHMVLSWKLGTCLPVRSRWNIIRWQTSIEILLFHSGQSSLQSNTFNLCHELWALTLGRGGDGARCFSELIIHSFISLLFDIFICLFRLLKSFWDSVQRKFSTLARLMSILCARELRQKLDKMYVKTLEFFCWFGSFLSKCSLLEKWWNTQVPDFFWFLANYIFDLVSMFFA